MLLSTDFRAFLCRLLCVQKAFVHSCPVFLAFSRLSCLHAQTFVSTPHFRAFRSSFLCVCKKFGNLMVFCAFMSSFYFVNQYFVRVQEFDKFKSGEFCFAFYLLKHWKCFGSCSFLNELKLSWTKSSVCEVIFALKILWKTFTFNKLKDLFQIELKLVFYTADACGVQNTAIFRCIFPMKKPDFFLYT